MFGKLCLKQINFIFLAAIPSLVAFEKNGLKVEFTFDRQEGQPVTNITLTATNSNPTPLNDFVFQAAVPKVCILQWCERLDF